MSKHYRLARGLMIVFVLLLAIFNVTTYLGWYYEGYINEYFGLTGGTTDTTDYESSYGELNEENCALLKEAEDAFNIQCMEEGAVLLKNDNDALPLSSDEMSVTLFGNTVVDPIYGSINTDRGGELYEAFTSAGFEINDTLYNAYKGSGVSRNVQNIGQGSSIGEVDISFYTDSLKSSWVTSYNDVAIVYFSRYCLEGRDLDPYGDIDELPALELHQQEADLLKMINEDSHFSKTVVLINSAHPMAMDWINDEQYGVDACISFGETGDTGFIGIANLLTGKADFSGHLVDTWATSSISAPAVRNFGDFTYSNHSGLYQDSYVVYAEDIYVGYKYYETRYQDQALETDNGATESYGVYNSSDNSWNYAEEMGYTFGHGLSYADFTQEVQSIAWDTEEHTVTAEVLVTNNGSDNYTGKSKSVVQLYAQNPYEDGQAEKSAIQLIGFAKSDELGAGESELVTVVADDYLFATYDSTAVNGADASKLGCYVYDAGSYYFAIGDDAHDALNNVLAERVKNESITANLIDENGNTVAGDADKVAMVELAETNNTWYATSTATGEVVSNTLDEIDYNYFIDDGVTYLTRSDWSTYPVAYEDLATNSNMDYLLAGKTYQSDGTPVSAFTTEAKNKLEFVDMKDVDYDDDVTWDKFLDQLSISDLCTIPGESRGNLAITTVSKPQNYNGNGPLAMEGSYKFGDNSTCTNYVDEVIMASTFNTELLYERGSFFAEDALYSGHQMIFGPGADWHRTPYSGRNAEYYSEDANLSYICGAAQCRAMTNGGLIAGIKHFAGNDQETNRHGVSTFATEQGFREGSLRCFEGALRDDVGKALGVMASFNRIGLTASSSSYAVQVQILRNEWGFKGVEITDASKDASDYVFTEESITSGTDMYDNDTTRTNELMKLCTSGGGDGTIVKWLRTANKHFYYAYSRSNLVNGVTSGMTVSNSTPWWKTTLIVIDSILGVVTIAGIAWFVVDTYVLKDKKKKEE